MNGRYRLVRKLGEGGFGSVHLAVDEHSGVNVAIKFLAFDTEDARARFEREGRVLYQQVNNRFVIDLLDYNFNHNPPFLVLEYCEGGSLQGWVVKRKPWRAVALALGHAVQGLHEIHAAGGFHRDLKPDNLLIGRDTQSGQLVVYDDCTVPFI